MAPVNGTLCTNHAEWIVESFMTPENPDYYFPDFDELTFTNIKAVTEAGKVAPISDGWIITAEPVHDSGKYLTDCKIVELDAMTCKWLGYAGIFT